MDLQEVYLKLGEAMFPKVQGSFNPESDELNEEIVSNFLSSTQGLLTLDQAVAEQGVRNKVLGATLGGMEEKFHRVVEHDPQNKVEKDLLKQIFESKDKATEKFLRYQKAQNAAYESELAELKNSKGKASAGNEKLNELIDTMRASLQEKEKSVEEALALLDQERQGRRLDKVNGHITSILAGRKWVAPNEELKQLSLKAVYRKAHELADFDFSENGEITPLQKGTDQPHFNKKSSKPQNMMDFIESIASPYLAKREIPQQIDDTFKGKVRSLDNSLAEQAKTDPTASKMREDVLRTIQGSRNLSL